MLYVTGDTHGYLDFQKILDWVGATKLNKDKDYLIILGDFGYVWENKRDNYEKEKRTTETEYRKRRVLEKYNSFIKKSKL